VNASAGTPALLIELTVTFISAVPAECGGEIAVQTVLDSQLTLAAFTPPNTTRVPDVPGAKPLPLISTLVPPVTGPLVGLTEVIAGTSLNWSAVEVAVVPPGVVTVMSRRLASPAGAIAVIDLLEVTLKPALGDDPNITRVAASKFVPVIVTEVPLVPLAGVIFVNVGGGT
jgi:hypothetical protein